MEVKPPPHCNPQREIISVISFEQQMAQHIQLRVVSIYLLYGFLQLLNLDILVLSMFLEILRKRNLMRRSKITIWLS